MGLCRAQLGALRVPVGGPHREDWPAFQAGAVTLSVGRVVQALLKRQPYMTRP